MLSSIIRSYAALSLILAPTTVSADTLQALVQTYAERYDVPYKPIYETMMCESGGDPTVQSGFYSNGKRERSYGLAQINLDAHPGITLLQAEDPDFALDYMAKQFALGNADMWTCYTMLKKRGTI